MLTWFRRTLGGGLMIGLAATAPAWASSPEGTPPAAPKAVIELFTSQGCSSCPPADALAGRLAETKDVIVLTLPVDYWDYLGWKDTLAKPKFSARQRGYAQTRGDSAIYTPQVVINGREHVVGSDKNAIDVAINRQVNRYHGLPVPVRVDLQDDAVIVDVGSSGGAATKGATVWLATLDKRRSVPIKRGENRGHTGTYYNVVESLQPIGMWKGKPERIELPRNEILEADPNKSCAVIVQVDQNGLPGAILGAAILPQ